MNIFPEWFWSNVRVTRRKDTCWTWRGHRYSNGYGRVSWQMRQLLAHRVAYELTHGTIPEGLHIIHSCDIPACVNPAHLRAGTRSDNMRDCVAKRRNNPYARAGAKNPKAKLTESDVKDIRRARAEGATTIALGRQYNVTPTQISYIALRKSWRHI